VKELNYVSEDMFPCAAHLQTQVICAMTVFWVKALQDMEDTVKRQWQEYGKEKRRERTAHRGDAVGLGSWSRQSLLGMRREIYLTYICPSADSV